MTLLKCSAFMSRSRLMLLCARWMRWLGELNVTLTGASSLHAIHSCVCLTYPPFIHQTLMFCVCHVFCDRPSSLTSVTALESCLFYFHFLCLPVGFTVPWLTSPYDLELYTTYVIHVATWRDFLAVLHLPVSLTSMFRVITVEKIPCYIEKQWGKN